MRALSKKRVSGCVDLSWKNIYAIRNLNFSKIHLHHPTLLRFKWSCKRMPIIYYLVIWLSQFSMKSRKPTLNLWISSGPVRAWEIEIHVSVSRHLSRRGIRFYEFQFTTKGFQFTFNLPPLKPYDFNLPFHNFTLPSPKVLKFQFTIHFLLFQFTWFQFPGTVNRISW